MTTTGIHFSNTHCYAAEVSMHATPTIINALSVSHDLNNFGKTIQSIKPLLRKKTNIIVGVSHQMVAIRSLTLDHPLSDQETIAFLQSRAEVLFGHAAHELYFDYTKTKDNQHHTITAVAAHQHEIKKIQAVFKKENLMLRAIDIDTFALARFTAQKNLFVSSETTINLEKFSAALGLCLWRNA